MGFEVTSMHDYVYIISPQRVLARFALSQDYARNICYCCLKKNRTHYMHFVLVGHIDRPLHRLIW